MFSHVTALSASMSFLVSCGELRVTDPCYGDDIKSSGAIKNVRNGTWLSQVGYFNEGNFFAPAKLQPELHADPKKYYGRVAFLRIAHESSKNVLHSLPNHTKFTENPSEIGVDSGMAGFFDATPYVAIVEDMDTSGIVFNKFYDFVCDITLTSTGFGVTDFGAVSSTGYGDGCYKCLERRVDGALVEALIIFITDEVEEEEDEENSEQEDWN
jgi:hypothetical protein